jgi:hypothetical protein
VQWLKANSKRANKKKQKIYYTKTRKLVVSKNLSEKTKKYGKIRKKNITGIIRSIGSVSGKILIKNKVFFAEKAQFLKSFQLVQPLN